MFKGIVFFIKNGWKYDKKYILWRVLYQFINSLIPIVVTSLINGLPRILGIEGTLGGILRNMFIWFLSLQKGIMALFVGLVFAACGTISYLISRRVMVRREF